MTKPLNPCVVYIRRREHQRAATAAADHQQAAVTGGLKRRGWHSHGGFGDPEFAEPFCGWLEPREGWRRGLQIAERVAAKEGACSIIILRADAMGDGDLFLPQAHETQTSSKVSFYVAGFSLAGAEHITPLPAALEIFARVQQQEREQSRGTTISTQLIEGAGADELVFVPDRQAGLVRAYFVNRTDRAMSLDWQATERPLLQTGEWTMMTNWHRTTVPPSSPLWLQTFYQGDPLPKAHRWRFRVGQGWRRWIGNPRRSNSL